MSDDIWKRDEIESPCTKVCVIHKTGLCVGCFRTLDEIAEWSEMTPENRRKIMVELPDREGTLAKRRSKTDRTRKIRT